MADLPPPVDAAVAAANGGDTEAFLDVFTTDGAVDDWGREFVGRDAIRAWSDREFIGVQVSLEVTAVSTDGATVAVSAQVGGGGFNGPSTFSFALVGDRVGRMVIRG